MVHGESETSILLDIENVLEFWVDSDHYFGGDYYAYCRAPIVLRLDPGAHVLNVRLVRDVRLFGAQSTPDLSINFVARVLGEHLYLNSAKCVMPDTVKGRPVGDGLSISLTNTSFGRIDVHSVEVTVLSDGSDLPVQMSGSSIFCSG